MCGQGAYRFLLELYGPRQILSPAPRRPCLPRSAQLVGRYKHLERFNPIPLCTRPTGLYDNASLQLTKPLRCLAKVESGTHGAR
jgi:hypothetical protein